MREIALHGRKPTGLVALVDDADYKRLAGHVWRVQHSRKSVYASRVVRGRVCMMHNEIASPPDGMVWDHVDRDGLNNQRVNLRPATRSQNQQNRSGWTRADAAKSSGFKGVSWDKSRKLWMTKITVDYKTVNLGRCATVEEAAKVYDEAAKKYFGEYARPNGDAL